MQSIRGATPVFVPITSVTDDSTTTTPSLDNTTPSPTFLTPRAGSIISILEETASSCTGTKPETAAAPPIRNATLLSESDILKRMRYLATPLDHSQYHKASNPLDPKPLIVKPILEKATPSSIPSPKGSTSSLCDLDQYSSFRDCKEVLCKNSSSLPLLIQNGSLNKLLTKACKSLKNHSTPPIEIEAISRISFLAKSTITCIFYTEQCQEILDTTVTIKKLIPELIKAFSIKDQLSILLNLEMINEAHTVIEKSGRNLTKDLENAPQDLLPALFEIVINQERYDLALQILPINKNTTIDLSANKYFRLWSKAIEIKNEDCIDKILSSIKLIPYKGFHGEDLDFEFKTINDIVSFIGQKGKKHTIFVDDTLIRLLNFTLNQEQLDISLTIVQLVKFSFISLTAKDFVLLCTKALELGNKDAFAKILSQSKSFEYNSSFSKDPEQELQLVQTIVSHIAEMRKAGAPISDSILTCLLGYVIRQNKDDMAIEMLPLFKNLPPIASFFNNNPDLLQLIFHKALDTKNEVVLQILIKWAQPISHKIDKKAILIKAFESGLQTTVRAITSTWANIKIPEDIYDEALKNNDEKWLVDLLQSETSSFEGRSPLFEKLHEEFLKRRLFQCTATLHLRWYDENLFTDRKKHSDFIREAELQAQADLLFSKKNYKKAHQIFESTSPRFHKLSLTSLMNHLSSSDTSQAIPILNRFFARENTLPKRHPEAIVRKLFSKIPEKDHAQLDPTIHLIEALYHMRDPDLDQMIQQEYTPDEIIESFFDLATYNHLPGLYYFFFRLPGLSQEFFKKVKKSSIDQLVNMLPIELLYDLAASRLPQEMINETKLQEITAYIHAS